MKRINKITFMRLSLLSAGLVVCATAANAATTGASFQVTANVVAQCSVTANNLAFGAVDPISASNVDQSTTLSVKCTKNSPYTVGLNAGATTGSAIGARLMANGASDFMSYNLYTDSARSTVWGNSSTAPVWVSGTGAGMGTAQVLTVYGRVPTGQTNLAVGSYTETAITVTVTY